MKINGHEINGLGFAFDGCHKIYVLKDKKAVRDFRRLEYDIYKLDKNIIQCYIDSCPLRFIDEVEGENIKTIVPQCCKTVVFEGFGDCEIENTSYNMVVGLEKDKVILALIDADEECEEELQEA